MKEVLKDILCFLAYCLLFLVFLGVDYKLCVPEILSHSMEIGEIRMPGLD